VSLIFTFEHDRYLSLDLHVESDLLKVEVLKVATHRVMLLLLDNHRHRIRPFDLEVKQRVALTEDDPRIAALDLERNRVGTFRIDDPGNLAIPPQAAGGPGAELIAGRSGECGAC
jgi:hypothetical protein